MRLYFPVDLTGNLIMIEKYSLGLDLNRGPPDLQSDALTSSAIKTLYVVSGISSI